MLAIHFLETDQAQHRFWQFMPGEPRHDPGGPHTHAIRRVEEAGADHFTSDCPMAGDQIAHGAARELTAEHPLSLLRHAYGI